MSKINLISHFCTVGKTRYQDILDLVYKTRYIRFEPPSQSVKIIVYKI